MPFKEKLCVVAVCGILFIGYCIYFDRKRRSDPNFKQKLKERKRVKLLEECDETIKQLVLLNKEDFPEFFKQEVALGEKLLDRGDFMAGIEHLCIALVICGPEEQTQFLKVLERKLISPVFETLLQRLPNTVDRIAIQSKQCPILEEDVNEETHQ